MSIYSIVEKPLILTNSDRNNHLEKYAKQFTTNPCIVKTNFVIGTFSKHNLTSRPSTRAYLNYQHKINTQLTELNNNMSHLIRESVTGIDNLCNKVRDCLMDFEDSDRQTYIKKHKEREDFIDFEQPPSPQQILQQLQDCVVEKQCYESILQALIEDINMKIEKLIIPHEMQHENAIVVPIPDEIERKNSEKVEEKPQVVEKSPKEVTEKENTEEMCKNVSIERDLKSSPIQPEVYRKKATSNLHERLKKEIESNDSFLNFQKLMHDYQQKCEQKKKPKKPNDPNLVSKKLKMHSITTKYKDSLWFSQQSPIIKQKKPRKIENKSIKRPKTTFPSCTHIKLADFEKMPKKKPYTSSCTIQLRNKSTRSSTTSLIRKKPTEINCLDDLTSRDLAPLHSEYPRRDNDGISHTNIKNTYLYKLLYSDENSMAKIWQKLFAKPHLSIPEESDVEMDETRAIRDKLRPHLIDPEKQSHPPMIVMPVRLYYNNPSTNQAKLPLVPIREPPPTVETLKVQLSLKKANKSPSASSMKQVSSRNEMKPKSMKISAEKPAIPRLNLRPDTKKSKKAETVSLDRDKKKLVISRLTTPKKPATVRKVAMSDVKIKKPQIVSQLESLRDRNDVIQRNIQKAINVIEMKMIDILSTPSDTTNSDAFDAMEKEITNVLTVMKSDEKSEKIDTNQLKAHIEALNENVDELIAHSPKKLKTIVSDEEVPKNSARKRREKITKTQSTDIKHVSNSVKQKEMPKKSTKLDGMESGDTKEDSNTVTTSKSKIKQQLDNNFSDCYKDITKHSEQLKESYHELETVAKNSEEEKWSEQLHKILTKMENVYQDIEESDNEDSKSEHQTTTSPIKSEIFYTPFMQLLRELRQNTADVDEKIKQIQSSPSCYNVLSFLNTLTTDTREDEPKLPEIHTTKYCYYLHIEYEAIVEPVVTVTDWVRYLCSRDVIEKQTIAVPKKMEACNQVNLIEQRHLPHNIGKLVKSNTIQLNLIEDRIRQNINELLQCNIVKQMFRHQNVKRNFNVDAVRVVEKCVKQNTARMTVIQDDVICLLRNILRETSALELRENRLASAAIMPMNCTDLDDYKQQRLIILKYLYALIFIVMFGAFNINIRCPFL